MVASVRFGIILPNFGPYYNPRDIAQLAREAEKAGWQGFFLWDHLILDKATGAVPFVDPWITLSSVAMNTVKISIGTLISPLARRRPWKLARETVSLDHLSNGRLILGAGLGAPADDFVVFGEEIDDRIRARKLDEGLDILTGLWSSKPFSYQGEQYTVDEITFKPGPVKGRIPIWIAGMWPNKKPFIRAARYDGVCPIKASWPDNLMPDDVREIVAFVKKYRGDLDNYEVVITGETSGDPEKDAEIIIPYIEAGMTWWNENINWMRGSPEEMIERIRKGPPRI